MPPPETPASERLRDMAAALAVPMDAQAEDRLVRYLGLLQRWNAAYNLTAVRNLPQMLSHHLGDCMAVLPPLMRHVGRGSATLLDVGSGAGLPGVVIAVLAPGIQVTCSEPVGKKAAFIRQVAAELAMPNLKVEHARVEQGEGRFDVITSRAFGSLVDLVTLTRGRLTEEGVWMAMKGQRPDEEMAALPGDIRVFHVEQLRVPGLDAKRCLVWMRPIDSS